MHRLRAHGATPTSGLRAVAGSRRIPYAWSQPTDKGGTVRLEGKVALITGGNSGIGRGIVYRFVDEGARVAFVGRDERKGAAVADEVKRRNGVGDFFAVDLARENEVAALVDDVTRLL